MNHAERTEIRRWADRSNRSVKGHGVASGGAVLLWSVTALGALFSPLWIPWALCLIGRWF